MKYSVGDKIVVEYLVVEVNDGNYRINDMEHQAYLSKEHVDWYAIDLTAERAAAARDAEQAVYWYGIAKEAIAGAAKMKGERDEARDWACRLKKQRDGSNAYITEIITERDQANTDHECCCAEYTRLRELLTQANAEILFWRKQAQHWHDKACPDRTKPFTVGVEE